MKQLVTRKEGGNIMKVFISWSGDRSRAVAELLSEWIRCVLQAARPWVSTQNIDRGALWFNEIQLQLQDATVGIVCLTQENKLKPWILFEAGALAKGLSASRVCTFLVDLNPSDVENPLAQFNHTQPTEESLWQLVRTLNGCLPKEQALHDQVLDRVFETYWPQFQRQFGEVLAANPPGRQVPERAEKDILSEILENTRSLGVRVSDMEKRGARSTFTDIGGAEHLTINTPSGSLSVGPDGNIVSTSGISVEEAKIIFDKYKRMKRSPYRKGDSDDKVS